MTLQATAVIALAFAPAAPLAGDREGVRAWIDTWWHAADNAGMHFAHGDLPGLIGPVEPDENQWLALLAGRQREDAGTHAVAFRAHDVVGVLVRIEVDGGGAEGVAAALALLPSRDVEVPSVLGDVRIVVARAADPASLDPGDVLRTLGLGEGGLQFGAVIEHGALLAEVEVSGRRTMALVVPEHDLSVEERLLGIYAGPTMGTLARYLVHGAKLRYLTGVFQAEQPTVRAVGQRSDESLSALFRLHETLEGATGRLDQTFFDANSRLGRAQGDAAGLAVMATRLRDLSRSTQIAARNLRTHAPAVMRAAGTGGATSFSRDAELADWLHESVEQELGYLASAKERAAEAQQLTQLRLEQASEEEARLSNRLTTLQTSVLGAVLGFLGVMEAFGTSFASRPELFWPIFVTVPALALLVPPLTLRWVIGLSAADVVAGAACAATAAWALTVIADADPLVCASAIGAAGSAGGAVVALHRRRQQLGPA